MIENFDMSLVDWSRAQFALTAMYHWIFVPLTLGLAFIIAIMETIYVKTGNPEWKKITKFWMTLFGINFAIGVATGIILEFEFGTNWSNYSWFVGDIFGAPLAVEGIMAFFMESTFIAVMFFGWNKVSKKFHLISTWLVAVGSNLSALWILVANGWMQNPVGMKFNPDTARNEMVNFWDVLFSPTAVNKFLHTISSAYTLAAIFVIGVSAWYLLKKLNVPFAKKSIVVAAVFGLITSLFTVMTGDNSAREIVRDQPMKFAAMEGLYDGSKGAGLVAFGIMSSTSENGNDNMKDFNFKLEIPNLLSYMAYMDGDAFVPGVNDVINGFTDNDGVVHPSVRTKIEMGRKAIHALKTYKKAQKDKDVNLAQTSLDELNENFKYFGYGYFDDPYNTVPPISITFYSFHIMVGLGMWFLLLFTLALLFVYKESIVSNKWFLRAAIWSIPLAYVASQSGWIVAEMGRQPWVIQDLMPTLTAVSNIDITSVQITFFLFLTIFTGLLIAEIKIMLKQIKLGPNHGGH
ncbi:cytochrome ubiquinol oxidase subunit I [Marinifilum flexuosum]|uniref:Cytochrome bd-I ubiquinol oxidase subunit 1 apoprotein n=1 Tax=Marinifilum flexuosum TaxID=1117708 RepID=A0A419X7F0_9BACT|nr:cytochrome ubiquinol oxidase subunit I [Marinifilum flexuosum]RKE03615.1 cytochrome bd-I ubiquinol oxidase subunit 1 apoprotein [Marinifilum flexuosum]